MSRYPGARWRPTARHRLGGSSCLAMTRYDGAIDHTYVGSPSPDTAFAHFNTSGNPTPHFMFHRDGTVDQYIDTAFRSSACLDGNARLITWETADGYPGLWSANRTQAPRDTPAMVQAKAKLLVWLHKEHGIPLERMPSSRPTARGAGWHRLGIDGNYEQAPGQLLGGRVSGGEHWSTSAGKTCPTSTRIHQYVEETLPAAVTLAKPPVLTKRVPARRVFHVHGKTPYRVEDSMRGVKLAAARAFRWIDLDCHVTSDGVLVITHWPKPDHEGFHADDVDSRGKTIEQLTWSEVEKLRTADRYRIQRADVLLPRAIRLGLRVELELKSTAITEAHLATLRADLPNPKRVQVKALPDFYTALRGARRAGFETILLARGGRFPKAAQRWLTYRRGTAIWV